MDPIQICVTFHHRQLSFHLTSPSEITRILLRSQNRYVDRPLKVESHEPLMNVSLPLMLRNHNDHELDGISSIYTRQNLLQFGTKDVP